LQLADRHSTTDSHLTGAIVDRPDRVESPEAENDLATKRNRAADKAGVATLQGESHLVSGTEPNKGGNLVHRAGPDHHRRVSPVPPGPVDHVRRDKVRIGENMLAADHLLEGPGSHQL
jgi:hypothetical protein